MSVYSEALDALCVDLDALELEFGGEPMTVTRDPVELMSGTVAVLVSIASIEWPLMCGTGVPTLQARLVGVAADSAMSDLLDVVDLVADTVGATDAVAATWTPPGADPLPCFVLTQQNV